MQKTPSDVEANVFYLPHFTINGLVSVALFFHVSCFLAQDYYKKTKNIQLKKMCTVS